MAEDFTWCCCNAVLRELPSCACRDLGNPCWVGDTLHKRSPARDGRKFGAIKGFGDRSTDGSRHSLFIIHQMVKSSLNHSEHLECVAYKSPFPPTRPQLLNHRSCHRGIQQPSHKRSSPLPQFPRSHSRHRPIPRRQSFPRRRHSNTYQTTLGSSSPRNTR
jgi:hypothetical protein